MCPRPAARQLRHRRPSEASNGTSTRETLSPTPPVECLSTVGRDSPERSMTSPERHHGAGEAARFPERHAVEVHGHQPGCDLFVGDGARHVSVDKPADFVARQLTTVALGPDQVHGVETGGGRAGHSSTPARFRCARCRSTEPWPGAATSSVVVEGTRAATGPGVAAGGRDLRRGAVRARRVPSVTGGTGRRV